MEFLYPSEGDDNHVILLIIVFRNQQSRLICYEWDCRYGLNTAQPKGSGQRIRPEEQLPLLLIPLTKHTAFMLVSENNITLYKDILTGNASAHHLPLYGLEPPEAPWNSKKPLWTNWARPSRHDLHVQKQDSIYLCREDGVVHFLEINNDAAQSLNCTHRAGNLDMIVDTSFASIDLGAKDCDLLIAGGSLCDGGGWLFKPRECADKKLALPNWTPLIDFTVDNRNHVRQIGGSLLQKAPIVKIGQSQPRMFASAGAVSKYGAIVEIRYGVKAIRTINTKLPQPGVTQIWALEWLYGNISSVLLLLSYPTTTALMKLSSNCISEGVFSDGDPENLTKKYSALDYDSRTLAAAATSTGFTIQVTNNSIRAISTNAQIPFTQMNNIMAASVRIIDDENSCAILSMAIQGQGHTSLHLIYIVDEGEQIVDYSKGQPLTLSFEPSFISLESIGEIHVAFVGTTNSTVQAYECNPQLGLTLLFEHVFEGQFAICESIAILTIKSEWKSQHLLICGLRNGFVEIFYLNHEPSG